MGNHLDGGTPKEEHCTEHAGPEGLHGEPPGEWRRSPVALIGAFPPPLGGQAIYTQRLAEELRARGIRVTAVDVAARSQKGEALLTRGKLALQLFAGKFSIFHLTASDSRLCGFELIIALASVVRGIPFVYNILAGRFTARVAGYSFLHRLVVCGALRQATKILVSNEAMASELARFPLLSHASVEVIGCRLPLGIEPEEDPELVRFLKGGRPGIVAIGALRMVYGFDLLAKACTLLSARGLRPHLLVIVSGTSEPDAQLALDAAAQAAGHAWAMVVSRDLPRARVLGAIKAAAVLARPTTADGDSLSIHEAQALGVPVVASDAAPRPPGVALHRSGDPASLAEAILSASGLPREPIAEDATLVEKVVACYHSVCGKAP